MTLPSSGSQVFGLSCRLAFSLCSRSLRLAASSAFCCSALARCSSRSCFMTLALCSASRTAASSWGFAAEGLLRSLRACLFACFCLRACSASCSNLAASAQQASGYKGGCLVIFVCMSTFQAKKMYASSHQLPLFTRQQDSSYAFCGTTTQGREHVTSQIHAMSTDLQLAKAWKGPACMQCCPHAELQ